MRALGIFVGLLAVVAGVLLVAAPDTFVAIAEPFATTAGLYAAALIRVAFGVILWRASRVSRAPAALRVIGIIVVIAGVTTPFVGADRARAMLDWWVGQGPALMRVVGGIILLLGGAIIHAFTTRRASN